MRSGLAEVIKYGIIMDRELFEFLEGNALRALDCDLSVIEDIVIKSFKHKIDVVKQDERDTKGIRATLNFGHTVGHALEAATSYRKYAHGEAIAIGMLCACDLAVRLDMFDQGSTDRIEALCKHVDLPTRIADADIDSIMQYMQRDKKFIAGKNRFVLPTAIGKVELRTDIPETMIRWVLKNRMLLNGGSR
jgi:3-dehydroquinate synthase